MVKKILVVVVIAVQLFGAALQCGITDMVSGQAMAMPAILLPLWIGVLSIVYFIAIFIDHRLNQKNLRYFALLLQMAVIGFTIKRYLYYRDLMTDDIDNLKIISDKYPPGDENFMVVVLFSMVVFTYNIFKLLIQRKW